MIENFTKEELQTIIKELKAVGYEVKPDTKQAVMKEVAGEIFGGEPFVCADIGGSIFKISDYILNNYEKRNGKKYTRKNVPKNIEDEYKKIMSGLLTVIKPYYGMLGFRDQNHS